MDDDKYKTIKKHFKGEFVEQKSRFISFAFPIKSAEDALVHVEHYRRTYAEANHVCWAYILGVKRDQYRFNDDGEPSGTAGRPIFGQINAYELTNIMVLVVRYFGGIKLGSGGLVSAYQRAAKKALESAEVVTQVVQKEVHIRFNYAQTNAILRIINTFQAKIINEIYTEECDITLSVRQNNCESLLKSLGLIESVELLLLD